MPNLNIKIECFATIKEEQRKTKYSPNIIIYFRYKNALLYLPFYATKEFQENTIVFNNHISSLCDDNAERIYKKRIK